jgi:hypothetical protein
LAVHFTLLELHCGLLSVRPREFTALSWTRANLKNIHPDYGGSSHLHRYIQHTNQRIMWVAREVLIYGMDIGSLKKSLGFFILVAESVFKFNNFNSVFQIVEALKLPAIKRLSAWESLSVDKLEKFRVLSDFCDSCNNYASYRLHLRGLGSQARIPCLPVLLKDISLLEMSSPWTVSSSTTGGPDCCVVDLHKLNAMFRLLCRDIFSLKSAFITSFYTTKLLCRVSLQSEDTSNDVTARRRRGRASRIDSRNESSLFTESAFLNDPHTDELSLQKLSLITVTEEDMDTFPSGSEDSEDEDDIENTSHVLICMSLNNGAIEEDYFNDYQELSCHSNIVSYPMPTSSFLTVTSYLPVPLFSLKMMKQLQEHDKHLELKIQQQMAVDIAARVSSSTNENKNSPFKKSKANCDDYPDPVAVIPHNMSIAAQDAVQSYAQCIDQQLLSTSTHFDSGIVDSSLAAADDAKKQGKSPKKKKKNVFSLFGSSCGVDSPEIIRSNLSTNIMLTAYDRKVVQFYRNTTRYFRVFITICLHNCNTPFVFTSPTNEPLIATYSKLLHRSNTDLQTLWEWSKLVNEDGKHRLLSGLVQAGLA